MLAPATRLLLTAIFAAPIVLAAVPQKPAKAINPVTLVSRAEKLIQKGQKEEGSLMLWQALDLLRGKASNAVEQATVLSARYLLKENDPLEMERRAAFTAVATAQTDLAKSYRIKKWYDTAQTRLDVAAQFDPDVIGKESKTLAAKRKGTARSNNSRKKPSEVAKPKAPEVSKLLRAAGTKYRDGPWSEIADGVRVAPKGDEKNCEWICAAEHKDHEIIVELRPDDPKHDWNAAIAIGQRILPGTRFHSGYRCYVLYEAQHEGFQIYIQRVAKTDSKFLGLITAKCNPQKDGYHLLAVRVDGRKIEFQIDGEPATTVTVAEPVSGAVGLMHSLANKKSCAINFRNFQIRPLPVDAPSDDQLREQAAENQQHQVTTAVEEAKQLIAKKKQEAASQRLRDAIVLLQDLPEGILRTNMQKSITTMLKKADKVAKKRERAATTCANTFGLLADKYVLDGRPRLALRLVRQALRFDPLGQAKRLAAIEKAVDVWNTDQLTTNAAALAPPKNDGKQLREWFVQNRLLDSRSAPWIATGASARVTQGDGNSSVLMPKTHTLLEGSIDVHMHLPAVGSQGGVAFDAAGPHDYTIAFLGRGKAKLTLTIARWAGGKWIYLGNAAVPLDRWRLEGWHHLRVELAASGITVKAGDTAVTVKRKRLGLANGKVGLYAAGGKGNEAVEIRAFEAKPK